MPAFEDSKGNYLSETNAILRYVANDQLKGGSNAIDQALVQQYIDFADNEVLPSASTWTFPTLGFRQYNKQDTEKAIAHIKKCMELLNNLLLSRTFLVGERVTLADISLCCNMLTLYIQVRTSIALIVKLFCSNDNFYQFVWRSLSSIWWKHFFIQLESAKLCFLVLTCQDALRSYVLTCLVCLMCSRFNVPCMLTCSHGNVPCVLTCSRVKVP